LKNHLAHYLRTVRKGQAITVTRRGKPVARLVPFSPTAISPLSPNIENKLWELASQGLLSWNGGSFQLPEPVATNRSNYLLSDLVVDDRE
jgi:antitoxin (DNA-binding transcriptional repressor) of toxin-antitoxin stability system